jgi:hypothetical protein
MLACAFLVLAVCLAWAASRKAATQTWGTAQIGGKPAQQRCIPRQVASAASTAYHTMQHAVQLRAERSGRVCGQLTLQLLELCSLVPIILVGVACHGCDAVAEHGQRIHALAQREFLALLPWPGVSLANGHAADA